MYIMKLSEELTWRGFVGINTFDDIADLDKQKRKSYLGVDPSADSMTIGNLASLMMCRIFAEHGHELTLLVGGGTGKIGDPKMDKERPLKPTEEIEQNAKIIANQYKQIMGSDIKIVNNDDWLGGLGFYKFMNEVGQYFSMTQLLDRDFVKARTGEGGSGLSVAEFSYSLLQGYDFLHLFREYGIDLQLCGEDQFGNCISGVQLIRKRENARADVFGMPLVINKSTGKKFGKSEGGAVWLAPEKTSPYQFYQFWLNVDDAGVIDYLKIYTFLGQEEINALAENHFENPGERAAQRTLAHEVTELVHGRDVTESVERVTRVLFGGADFSDLTEVDLNALAREIPTVELRDDLTVVDALTESKVTSSNSEATRLIKQNAISVNGMKITDDKTLTEKSLIKKGKNQFVLVR
jgi:tyrosyl-tRNA synthetase